MGSNNYREVITDPIEARQILADFERLAAEGRTFKAHELLVKKSETTNKGELLMSGVGDVTTCPVCGGEMETYLETKTGEDDAHCGTCGYYSEAEIRNINGRLFWERVVRLPMTHEGLLLGDGLVADHRGWGPEMVARPENCDCYGCQHTDAAVKE